MAQETITESMKQRKRKRVLDKRRYRARKADRNRRRKEDETDFDEFLATTVANDGREEEVTMSAEELETKLASGLVVRLPNGLTAMLDSGALNFKNIDAIAHESVLSDPRIRWRETDSSSTSIKVADQRSVEKDSRIVLLWADGHLRPLRTIITRTICKTTPWKVI